MGTRTQAEPGLVDGDLLAGRYRIEREVGRGAYGIVYRAIDRITDEPLAIKLLRPDKANLSSLRWREAAALRRLRIPGVAELYGEGYTNGWAYLAMEWIDGRHFFEASDPVGWDILEGPALELLMILSAVHRQGLVHGDLKPTNVLVDESTDRLKVLDFGLAVGAAANELDPTESSRGTPVFMAPELFRGRHPTPQSDLFAVGVMLFEALTGRPLFETSSFIEWIRRLNTEGPPSLREVSDDPPRAASVLVDALLQPNPGDRPQSAADAIDLLRREDSLSTVRALRDQPWTVDDLEELFEGIEPGFHLRSGPAQEIFARTGGHPEEVVEELRAWAFLGLAQREGDRYTVSTGALSALRSGLRTREPLPLSDLSEEESRLLFLVGLLGPVSSEELVARLGLPRAAVDESLNSLARRRLAWASADGWRALRHLEVSHDSPEALRPPMPESRQESTDPEVWYRHSRRLEDPESFAFAALNAAVRRAARSDVDGARSAFREARQAARGKPAIVARVEYAWADFALQSPSLEVVEEALWAMTGLDERLVRLVEGHRLALVGRKSGVAELLGEIGELDDPRMEVHRLVSIANARSWEDPGFDALNERIEELIETNDGMEDLRSAAWMRQGMAMYAKGNYEESAHLQLVASRATGHQGYRLKLLAHAAWGFLDAYRFDRAEELAREASKLASDIRQPQTELFAILTERMARYRGGESLEVDREFLAGVELAGETGLRVSAAILESALAWRAGAREEALELIRPVGRQWSPDATYAGLLLAAAFWSFLERAKPGAELIQKIEACALPRLKAQMLGFLSPGVEASRRRRWASQIAELVPPDEHDVRLEIISTSEAIALASWV